MEKDIRRKAIEEALISKAMKDMEFRKKLMDAPAQTIKEELGIEIPEDVSLRIIEESENEVCLVIPAISEIEGEMSDIELESVAGGDAWTTQSYCGSCDCTQDQTFPCDPGCHHG